MESNTTLLYKLGAFLRLSIPVIATQLAIVISSFVAVFLTGQYSTVHLAGISIGYNVWISVFLGISGVLLGITPIISQNLGANLKESIPHTIYQGLYIGTGLGLCCIILGYIGLDPLLHVLGVEPAAQVVTKQYMACIAIGFLPLLWMTTLRNVVDAHGKTKYSMTIIALSVIVGIATNYAFILGKWGAPALGGLGAGIGTATGYLFSLLCYFIVLRWAPIFQPYRLFTLWKAPQWKAIREQLQLGVPIGISIFAETSIFALAGLAMAQFGTSVIAAHQSAISFTNLVYAVPLSISMASTIVVAFEIGAHRLRDAMQYAYIARGIALAMAACICSYTFTHRTEVALLFSKDPIVIPIIETFMTYAVFFTAIDAFGTPIQGILRAYRDVKSISTIAITSYWGVSIPVVYYFLHYTESGPVSIWFGLLSAIGVGSIAFILRLAWIQHGKQSTLC